MIHSVYGGSGASIWIACNASVPMSEGMPFYTVDYNDTDGDKPAAIGTAAHNLAEFCFKLGINTYDCLGMTFGKQPMFPEGFIVDEGMAEAVQLYVGYINSLSKSLNVKPMIECRVVMLSVRPDVFGTSDCIFIVGDTLYVIDYKHGFVQVDIEFSKQFIFYALAALDTYGLWGQIKHIKTSVVQPRADHAEGSIRAFNYTIEQMYEWREVFRKAVLNPNPTPTPGTHCKYCPASAYCRPRIERTLRLAYQDKPTDQISIGEVEIIFNEIDVIKKNLEKIEKRMLNHARKGNNIAGWKLVSANKHFICTDEEKFINAAVSKGVDKEKLFSKKLISKSVAEKIVDRDIVDQFFIKPNAASTLARLSDSRPALSKGSAKNVFEAIE